MLKIDDFTYLTLSQLIGLFCLLSIMLNYLAFKLEGV